MASPRRSWLFSATTTTCVIFIAAASHHQPMLAYGISDFLSTGCLHASSSNLCYSPRQDEVEVRASVMNLRDDDLMLSSSDHQSDLATNEAIQDHLDQVLRAEFEQNSFTTSTPNNWAKTIKAMHDLLRQKGIGTSDNIFTQILAHLPGMRQPNATCMNLPADSFKTNYYNHSSSVPPNIIHFVHFFRHQPAELNVLDFLAFVSVERFLQPDVILFWSDVEPHGFYYELLLKHTHCINWQPIARVPVIGNKPVYFLCHEADFSKLKKLVEFGGTFLDFDVAVINGSGFREAQRGVECLTGCDENCTHLTIGVISCRPQSRFVQLWLDGYHQDFRPEEFVYNSNTYCADLLTNRTYDASLIRVDEGIANPNSLVQYDWLKRNGVPDWRSKTLTHYYLKMHLIRPRVIFTHDIDLVFAGNSIGEVFRHVLDLSDLPPDNSITLITLPWSHPSEDTKREVTV